MAFIDNIPTSASIDSNLEQEKKASNISNSTISSSIRNEENEEKANKLSNLRNWMDKRSSLRKAISKWEAGTWNVWLDTSEVRKSRLADLAREALINAWKDADKIKKTKDDDLIKRLVWSNEWTDNKKMNAVNNYLMNWWYAENVFNYLVWNTSSVYETMWEPKEEKWVVRNFLWAVVSTPAESLAWMSEAVQENVKYWWKSIYDINKEADVWELWNLIWWISEEEYQKYKQEWSKRYEKAFNVGKEWYYNLWDIEVPWAEWIGKQYISRADFYDSYDKAKENWFSWNVEQYWQYIYNMATDTYNSAAEKVRNYLETEVYDPEWAWAWAGKFVWEMIEFALLPEMKMKYLKYLPEASKLEKVVKNAVNLAKWTTKLWVEWVKLQALEDAYNAEVSNIWEYATSAMWNVAMWWMLKWLWWMLGKMWWVDKLSLWTKTSSEIKNMINIAKGARNKNAEVTPFTKVRDLLTNAKKEILWDRLTKWKELWDIRNFELKFKDWAKYTSKNAVEEEINKALMQRASKKRFWWIAWKKSEIPQFKFTKNWLEISNPDVLNNISRNSKDWTVKLWDEIKRVYSETYWDWAAVNAATTEKFLRWLDKVFWKEWWSWWPENFINLMKEGVENATKKFDASLTEKSLSNLKKARLADEKAIKLDNTFNKIFNKLDWVEWVWAAEKATKDAVTTQELFKEVYKATNWKIDLNSEIWAWVAVMSAYDVKAAQRLLQTIYPSKPWAMELLIKTVLSSFTKWQVKRAAKDYTPSSMWRIWENIWWVVSSQL